MSKQSALTRRRAAQEAQRRRRQRRLWGIGVGAAALVLVAAMAATIYFAVRSSSPRVAEAGDRLSVYYTLWLADGAQVESNVGGSPFTFTLGAGEVIRGWDEGLAGMRVREKKTLTIPPDKAYGAQAHGSIPPNSTLTFEVELVAIE